MKFLDKFNKAYTFTPEEKEAIEKIDQMLKEIIQGRAAGYRSKQIKELKKEIRKFTERVKDGVNAALDRTEEE